MNKTQILTETKYSALLIDVRAILEEGKLQAAKAAAVQLASTYWHLGQRLHQEGLTDKAGYAQSILADLSEELAIDVSTLKRSMYFFQTYKSAPRSTFIIWSHYKELIAIKNKEERQWYENLIEKDKLSKGALLKAIRNDRFGEYLRSKGKPAASPKLTRPTEATYVYKALVERVIDGDTLMLRIDLGFQVFKEQRIRLAEIDTPPLDEPSGKKAYHFVRDQLAQVPFVMVKTNKIDIYGRYVGHIFYSRSEKSKDRIFAEGQYLNQELIDRGLARVL